MLAWFRLPHFAALPAVVASLRLLAACSHDPARDEASALLRVVSELRLAQNDAKRSPLERLRSQPCSHQDICDAKNACLEAFDHHVKGVELGRSLRSGLDAGSHPAPAASADLAAQLLEMNLEVEEGRRLMPDCNERVAALRRKHRL